MRKELNKFYFELTDTFGGEANYSWVHRFKVVSPTLRGALNKLSRHTGYHFQAQWYRCRWKVKQACIVLHELSNDFDDLETHYDFEMVE